MIGIYKITSPSGRIYIGQSIDIERRFSFYQILNCKQQPILYASLKKYGVDNHKFEVIEECLENLLDTKERFWQNHYDVLNGGLNCVLTNTNEETKRLSKETREKIAKSNTGKKFSEDHRKNLSETKKKTTLGENNSFYGKTHSKEYKEYRSKIRSNGGNPKAKLVINLETGIVYDCAKDAAKTINVNYNTFKAWLSGKYPNKSSFVYL